MNQLFENRGYKVAQKIQENARHGVYKLEKDGQFYIGKFNMNDEPVKIENDVWWSLTVNRMAGVNSPVSAPKMYEYGTGWFVSEFIEKPLLAESTPGQGDNNFMPIVEKMADILIWLDTAMDVKQAHALYDTTNSAPYDDLMKKVDGWLKAPLEAGITDPKDYDAARKIIDEYRNFLQPSLQHGDFVPWHMFDLGDKVCLYDGEHSGLMKPKYYDLAYLYTRLFTRSEAPEAARAVLRDFNKKSDQSTERLMQILLPVMTLRALGMQADAHADLSEYDYTSSVRDILQRCLARDLRAFTEA